MTTKLRGELLCWGTIALFLGSTVGISSYVEGNRKKKFGVFVKKYVSEGETISIDSVSHYGIHPNADKNKDKAIDAKELLRYVSQLNDTNVVKNVREGLWIVGEAPVQLSSFVENPNDFSLKDLSGNEVGVVRYEDYQTFEFTQDRK